LWKGKKREGPNVAKSERKRESSNMDNAMRRKASSVATYVCRVGHLPPRVLVEWVVDCSLVSGGLCTLDEFLGAEETTDGHDDGDDDCCNDDPSNSRSSQNSNILGPGHAGDTSSADPAAVPVIRCIDRPLDAVATNVEVRCVGRLVEAVALLRAVIDKALLARRCQIKTTSELFERARAVDVANILSAEKPIAAPGHVVTADGLVAEVKCAVIVVFFTRALQGRVYATSGFVALVFSADQPIRTLHH